MCKAESYGSRPGQRISDSSPAHRSRIQSAASHKERQSAAPGWPWVPGPVARVRPGD